MVLAHYWVSVINGQTMLYAGGRVGSNNAGAVRIATVAIANRLARLVWVLLHKQEAYRPMPA